MAKKAKKKPKKIYKLFSSLLALVSIIFIISLIYFNILPFIYQTIVITLITIIDLFLILLMLKSKKRKISALISFIIITIMTILSFYIFKTAGLMNNLNLNYKTYNYSVVVLKEGNYEKIQDLQNKELGFYETDDITSDKYLEKISKKVTTENTKYDDINKLAKDLLNNNQNAILLENSYLEILNEDDNSNNGIEDFSQNTKTIYEFSIIVKTSDISKDLDVTKEAFNIYVSGIDTFGSISSVSRSDVNMVVTVNPETRQILLTSIPRDYYIPLHGKTGYNDKLTHAGLYGTDMSIQTLEDLLETEINYYVKVNFTSVIEIVNALGGVEVYSDYDFTSRDGYVYKEGYNDLNGEEALSFARERKAFAAGDRQRVKNQQALLEAVFKKCTSASIISKYNNLLNSIEGSFTTNMPTDRLTSLVKMQLSKMYKWTITSNSLNGEDSSNYTYSYSSQKLYVMEPIEESVEYAVNLIKSIMNNEELDPTNDDSVSSNNKTTGNKPNKNETTTPKTEKDDSSESNDITTTKSGLKVSLGRTSVTLLEGEEFIYYGYTATFNKEDITADTTVTFSINGHTYTDYHELISYITNKLSHGEYNIVYKVKYNENTETLNQNVTIKENPQLEKEENNDIDDSISNEEENNDKSENDTIINSELESE